MQLNSTFTNMLDLKNVFFCLIWLCLPLTAAYAQEKPELPTTGKELQYFLEKIALQKLDVRNFSGTYALPRKLTTIGNTEIKYIKFEKGIVTLKKEANDVTGYIFVLQPSLDKLIAASTLGDLFELLKLPNGEGYGAITSHLNMLPPRGNFPGPFRVPLKFCFFSKASIVFCNALFPVKVSDEINQEKPLGSWGPLFLQIESSQVQLDNSAASYKEK